jgi:hypothetical protein
MTVPSVMLRQNYPAGELFTRTLPTLTGSENRAGRAMVTATHTSKNSPVSQPDPAAAEPPDPPHDHEVRALVDPAWYLAAYPDLAQAGVDPVEHFGVNGCRESRSPSRYFDAPWYLAAHPEAAPDPLLHYIVEGEAAGHWPCADFDPVWYRASYEVPAGMTALRHFMQHRRGGAVSPNPTFDAAFYLAAYPDVAAAGLDPFEHYCLAGRAELRLPRPEQALVAASGLFDANYYLINAADVLEAGADPVAHFCAIGWREGRKPDPYFDPAWYCRRVALPPGAAPLTHYILQGEARGDRPSLLFDPAWYRRFYGIADGASALAHYLTHRGTQRYSPLPIFDVLFYVETYRDAIRPGRDPFAHYLAIGAARDFDPAPWFNAAAYRRSRMAIAAATPELRNPLLHFLATIVLA